MTIAPVTVTPLDWRYMASKPEITCGDSGYATLDAILANAAVTSGVVVVSDTQTLDASSNRTLKAGLTLRVLQGGKVTIPTGRTFTVNGTINAGQYQIFDCVGTGVVSFASCRDLWARWWGTAGNGTDDDTTPINAAFAALSSTSVVLNFTPGDVHLVENLTWTVSGANLAQAGQRINFNGVRFKSNLAASADILTIANAVNQQIHLQGPAQFQGWSDYVWYKTGVGAAPATNLYFNATSGAGTAGTETTLLNCIADKNWHYEAADGGTLYIYVVAGLQDYNVPEVRYPFIQIDDAGDALTGWTKYFAGSAIVSNLCNFSAEQIFGRAVDNVLHLAGGEVGVAENIMGYVVNSVVKCTTALGNKPTALTLKNIRAQYSFGDIISADSGDSIVVDGLGQDFASGRVMNIANVEALALRNITLEVVGFGGVVTEGFLFDNVKGIDICAGSFAQGVYDVEDFSNAGRIMYFQNGCGGVKVHGAQILTGTHRVGTDIVNFYDHDNTLGGMDISGCYMEGLLGPAAPTATVTSCSYNGSTIVVLPMHLVAKADGRALTNYMGATHIADTTPDVAGCTTDHVTGLGGADTAFEITWNNATNHVNWASLFVSTGLSGSKYGLLSFKFKSSIAQRISFGWLKTGSATYASAVLKAGADSLWRVAFLPGPVNNFATFATVNEVYLTSTVASGTLTIDDDIQVLWFPTKGEMEAFVGKYAELT